MKGPEMESTEPLEKYLTFRLANECYGLEVSKLREMIGGVEVVPGPAEGSPFFGSIHRKGKEIPLLNLRRKFGLPEVEMTLQNSFVTVELPGSGEPVGLWVDAILALVDVPLNKIEPVSELLSPIPTDFLKGQIRLNGQTYYLLDLEKVLKNLRSLPKEPTEGAWLQQEAS
jgi:purine-binding chemotaxis protein CheW